MELTVYRIVQEALTNVMRHAGPRAAVELSLSYEPDAVAVSVVDDGGDHLVAVGVGSGHGGQPSSETRRAGHGLVGMRERVTVHGGQFEAGPRLSRGWHVAVTVPWDRAAEAAPA